jgi:parvulin-like peptidyl-prolyl isomerase
MLREPLLHFFVLGVCIFAAYGWLGDGGSADEIVVTRGQQLNLIETFERTWQRPPTPEEFRGLVQDLLRQEIAYREAGAMGLDRDDIVIRRRLQQKLELLTEDLALLAPPTEEELDAYFAERADDYRTDPRYSFEQIFFSTDRRGERAREDAQALLARLETEADVVDLAAAGDAISLPQGMRGAPRFGIAATFGSDFADALAGLATGAWDGPVESGFGIHLVRITELAASRIPARAEIAREVLNDLLAERRARAVDALYEGLARRYEIRVDPLEQTAAE